VPEKNLQTDKAMNHKDRGGIRHLNIGYFMKIFLFTIKSQCTLEDKNGFPLNK